MEDLLIKVIEKTNGWVLIVVVGTYFAYQAYKTHEEGRALDQTLGILNNTIEKLLASVDRNVSMLNTKVDQLIGKFDK